MSQTLYSQEFQVRQQGYSGKYYEFRLDIILDSQDDVNHKSTITRRVYAKADHTATDSGGNRGYASSNYIKYTVKGDSSETSEETLIDGYRIKTINWVGYQELTALASTREYTHNADGTLSVDMTLVIQHISGGLESILPIATTLTSGSVTVPAFIVETYSVLDNPSDMLLHQPMRFTFTPASAAFTHELWVQIQVNGGWYSAATDIAYTSGKAISCGNPLQYIDDMDDDKVWFPARASLTTKNGGTTIGTDTKTFRAYLTSVWINDDGINKPGLVWYNEHGTWERGIAHYNDNETWKRGKAI